MKVGYVRVPTFEQNLSLQIRDLKKAACKKIFKDKVSGSKAKRPGFSKALNFVRKGDKLLVWRLDRLVGSVKPLI